ncbi:MAG: bifunctional DNA-formamidopyrimidine glycosylase/DNA-(apurinic or apyrimidinic site) lyase [Pseudomonadota bacterium]
MPELPEVETTRRGVSPHVVGREIVDVIVRQPRLRWPVPKDLKQILVGQGLSDVRRRAKYLLLDVERGSAMVHLGMSGRLQVVERQHPPRKHDHVDIVFDNALALRLHDPRRFGAVLFSATPDSHPLIAHLGPEPLSEAFDPDYLYTVSRSRKQAIKTFIMNAQVVVGVGNIYASEALFIAGIHPLRQAGKLSRPRMAKLVAAIKTVLTRAIAAGGTTLRDFYGGDGSPGYFTQELAVYGRAGERCTTCEKTVTQRVIGQRSSFYCTQCQR